MSPFRDRRNGGREPAARSRARRRAVAAAAGLAIGVFTPVASADFGGDQTAPNPLKIRSGKSAQRGSFIESLWTTRSRGVCVGQDLVGSGGFPNGMAVKPGRRVRIHLPTEHRPIGVILRGWRYIDDHGRPIGNGHPIEGHLVPVRPDGTIESWKVRLRPDFEDHLYVALYSAWRGECHDNNWIQWAFHLRAP